MALSDWVVRQTRATGKATLEHGATRPRARQSGVKGADVLATFNAKPGRPPGQRQSRRARRTPRQFAGFPSRPCNTAAPAASTERVTKMSTGVAAWL
jgi:hypothetical protein